MATSTRSNTKTATGSGSGGSGSRSGSGTGSGSGSGNPGATGRTSRHGTSTVPTGGCDPPGGTPGTGGSAAGMAAGGTAPGVAAPGGASGTGTAGAGAAGTGGAGGIAGAGGGVPGAAGAGGPGAPGGGGAGGHGAGGGGDGGGAGGGGGGGVPPGVPPPPPPLSAVGMALSVCGANPFEIYALEHTERLNTLESYGRMTSDDVTQLASRLEKRPYPHNVAIPTSVVKNIQGMCFWSARARRQGRPLNYGDFTTEVLAESLDAMEIQAEKSSAPDIKPSALKEEDWEDWSQEFPTYLSHIYGKQKAPLDYVIRPDLAPTHVFASTREQELYSYPLGGPYYKEDNKEVFRLLSDLVKDQPATWIQPYQASQDGRRAWLALVDHFDGGGQKERRISKAEAILETVLYQNERVFSFDAYSAKLLRAFRTLDNTPNRRTASNQVKILIDNMKIATAEFAVIKSYVRSNHRTDLPGAIAYISRKISDIYPDVAVGGNRRNQGRHRFISETTSNPANRPRNFTGLQQTNGIYTFYGVDVTDVTRRFSSEEMATLGPAGQAYIHQERARVRVHGGRGGGRGLGGRGRHGHGGRGAGRGNGRGISEIQTGGDQSIITDITNNDQDTRTETGTATQGERERGSTNGRRFGNGAYGDENTGTAGSTGNGHRGMAVVHCGPQRRVGQVAKGWLLEQGKAGTLGRNEMDTMADTCCAGRNWTLLETTGMECTVNDFAGNQVGKSSVPVATCATVVREAKSGLEIVVIGHQMLWFGDKLDKTLLNQNQIRHAGHDVRDDPTRKDREGFGIWVDGFHIPFQLHGTTVYFESRAPSPQDIEQMPSVTVTRQEMWDPHTVDLSVQDASPYLETYGPSMAGIGEISVALTPEGITRELASRPRVKQVESSRHGSATAESLSRKWRIGLDSARNTLRVTTQQGIRTAISPITRRYRVDNLALHRNRLHTRFHTDTLFSKTTSLSGNKCAQLFTDGHFTAVYPLPSKAQVGQALAQFIDDVGIPDKLTADMAGEQFGESTLFRKLVRMHRVDIHWTERHTGKQNHRAEREIGLLKQRWHRRATDLHVPKRLWDFGLVYEAGILSRVARGQDGRTGLERLSGDTPDILEWIDFSFFDLVWFHNNVKTDTADDNAQLGYWLGIAHRIGSDLCYWVLTKSGKVIARTTVQHVTDDDMLKPEIAEKVKQFKLIVEERLDDRNFTDTEGKGPGYLEDMEDLESEEERRGRIGIVPSDEEYGDMVVEETKDADAHGEGHDEYIGAQIQVEVGGERMFGTVVKRQ